MRPAPDPVPGLRALAEACLHDGSADDLVSVLAATAHALLGADEVHITEVSEDAAVGHAHVTAFAPDQRTETYVQVIDDRPSGTARVVATGTPLHVPDAKAEGILRQDYVERFNTSSALFVPVSWDGDVRYVLILLSRAPRTFSPQEIALAELIADLAAAGLALREIRTRQASTEHRDAALARAAQALNAAGDRQTVLETLAREAAQAVSGDMGGVYLGDGVRGGVATAGWNTPEDWLGYVMQPGEGVGGQTLLTRRPAITSAYQRDVRLPENPGLRRLQTAVSVPLISAEGRLLGALSIGFDRMRRISRADLQTLEAIAGLAAIACRNAQPPG